MRIKNSRIVCIILVIFVMCSNLSILNMNMAIPFGAMSTLETDSYLTSVDITRSNSQVCTEETIGESESDIEESLDDHHGSSKCERKEFLLLFYSNALTRFGERFFCSGVMQPCDNYPNERITNYIHKLDGKKWI